MSFRDALPLSHFHLRGTGGEVGGSSGNEVIVVLPFAFLFLLFDIPSDPFVQLGDKRLLFYADAAGKIGDIGRTKNLVGYDADALHNAADSLRALHRVFHVLHRQAGLESDEVRLVLLDIFA